VVQLLGAGHYYITEARVLIAEWKKEYNQVRPHSAKGYKPPAPEAKMLVTLTL
jgi:transposase InsO family protein